MARNTARRRVNIYCLRAITTQLVKDGERPPGPAQRRREAAVAAARRFQTEAFAGRGSTMSSADLIREARENR